MCDLYPMAGCGLWGRQNVRVFWIFFVAALLAIIPLAQGVAQEDSELPLIKELNSERGAPADTLAQGEGNAPEWAQAAPVPQSSPVSDKNIVGLISGSFNTVLGLFLGFMMVLYFIQFTYCFTLSSRNVLALRRNLKPDAHHRTVIGSIFGTRDGGFANWFFILAAFFLPLLLGLIPDAAEFAKDIVSFLSFAGGADPLNNDVHAALVQRYGPVSIDHVEESVSIRWSQLVISICTVALTILITIEIIYISNFRQHEDNKHWYSALLAALILDVMTLIIMAIFSNSQSLRFVVESPLTNGMILGTTLFAVCASLIVILSVRQITRYEIGEIDDMGEPRLR